MSLRRACFAVTGAIFFASAQPDGRTHVLTVGFSSSQNRYHFVSEEPEPCRQRALLSGRHGGGDCCSQSHFIEWCGTAAQRPQYALTARGVTRPHTVPRSSAKPGVGCAAHRKQYPASGVTLAQVIAPKDHRSHLSPRAWHGRCPAFTAIAGLPGSVSSARFQRGSGSPATVVRSYGGKVAGTGRTKRGFRARYRELRPTRVLTLRFSSVGRKYWPISLRSTDNFIPKDQRRDVAFIGPSPGLDLRPFARSGISSWSDEYYRTVSVILFNVRR